MCACPGANAGVSKFLPLFKAGLVACFDSEMGCRLGLETISVC